MANNQSLSNTVDMRGCRIQTISKTCDLLQLDLKPLPHTLDYTYSESPTFILNGVVIFQFRLQKLANGHCEFFIRFTKKRVRDKLEYTIKYTHWMALLGSSVMSNSFTTSSVWHLCSVSEFNKIMTIIVEIDMTVFVNPCSSLYDDTELTDFKLCGDDGSVLIHKIVVATHSPFFKKMFEGKWKETTEGVIETPGISRATLQQLKEYMYLGTVPRTDLRQLLLLSSLYIMEDLEQRCLYLLRSQVTKENAHDLIQFGVAHKITRLVTEVLDTVQQGHLDVDQLLELDEQF